MYRLSPTIYRNEEEQNGPVGPKTGYSSVLYNSCSPISYTRNPSCFSSSPRFSQLSSFGPPQFGGHQGQQLPLNYATMANNFQPNFSPNSQQQTASSNYNFLATYPNQQQIVPFQSQVPPLPSYPSEQHQFDDSYPDSDYEIHYTMRPRPFNLFHPKNTSFPGFHVSPHKIGEYYHSHTSNYTSQHFPKYQHCYGRLNGQLNNMVPFPSSNCSGRKKALLIGINYFNTSNQLNGCINDVLNIKKFITKNYGFQMENIRVLTDDQYNNLLKMPTRQNILDSMCWLVDGAQPNDSLFFHYSGHGSQKKDYDGDEDDGYDETILPVDFEVAGHILDDEMNAVMVRTLPPGCRLTAVFDCCHSGTALDLPYVYGHDGRLKSFNPKNVINRTLTQLGICYLDADVNKASQQVEEALHVLEKGRQSEQFTRLTRGAVADVVMFSGCKDAQTSADVHAVGYGSTGAMSHALITALSSKPHSMTYLELLNALRSILRGKYEQLPQLSSGRPMDMNSLFIM